MDDNPADVDLSCDVLARNQRVGNVNVVCDGDAALAFIRREGNYSKAATPDLLLLDLNLPRKDGREVLAEMRSDPELARIPVVVFTTSQATADVVRSYELGANCYVRKPGNLAEFVTTMESMAEFWLDRATLPQKENS